MTPLWLAVSVRLTDEILDVKIHDRPQGEASGGGPGGVQRRRPQGNWRQQGGMPPGQGGMPQGGMPQGGMPQGGIRPEGQGGIRPEGQGRLAAWSGRSGRMRPQRIKGGWSAWWSAKATTTTSR